MHQKRKQSRSRLWLEDTENRLTDANDIRDFSTMRALSASRIEPSIHKNPRRAQ
jgi:hypothetical protein